MPEIENKPDPPSAASSGMPLEEARRIVRRLANHYGSVEVTVVKNGAAGKPTTVRSNAVDKSKT